MLMDNWIKRYESAHHCDLDDQADKGDRLCKQIPDEEFQAVFGSINKQKFKLIHLCESGEPRYVDHVLAISIKHGVNDFIIEIKSEHATLRREHNRIFVSQINFHVCDCPIIWVLLVLRYTSKCESKVNTGIKPLFTSQAKSSKYNT